MLCVDKFSKYDFTNLEDLAKIRGYGHLYYYLLSLKNYLNKLVTLYSDISIYSLIYQMEENFRFPRFEWGPFQPEGDSRIFFYDGNPVQSIVYLVDDNFQNSTQQDLDAQAHNIATIDMSQETFITTHMYINLSDLLSLTGPIHLSDNGPVDGSVEIILWLLLKIVNVVNFNDDFMKEICLFLLLLNMYLRLLNKQSNIYLGLSKYNLIFPLEGDLIIKDFHLVEYMQFLKMFKVNIPIYGLFIGHRDLYPISEAFIQVFGNYVLDQRALLYDSLYQRRVYENLRLNEQSINQQRIDTPITTPITTPIYTYPGVVVNVDNSLIYKNATCIIPIIEDVIYFQFQKFSIKNGAKIRKIYLIRFEDLIKYDSISALQLIIFNYERIKNSSGDVRISVNFFEKYLNFLILNNEKFRNLLNPYIPYLNTVIEREKNLLDGSK
jgi:hypothetical protein